MNRSMATTPSNGRPSGCRWRCLVRGSRVAALSAPAHPIAGARSRAEAFPHAALAWRTLAISAVSLALAFAVWFMWSAIPLRLKDAGFTFSRQQLFWLTATPVLLGSFLRIPYGLIVSTFGSRRSYAIVTLLLLLPCLGNGFCREESEQRPTGCCSPARADRNRGRKLRHLHGR